MLLVLVRLCPYIELQSMRLIENVHTDRHGSHLPFGLSTIDGKRLIH